MHWFVASNGIFLQYSSNYVMLRWVFPQVIAIWITLLFFIENKEKIQYYLTLMMPSMLFGTLSFIGIIPIAIGYALYELVCERKFAIWFRKVFSIENMITLFTLGSILILYFYGNILSEKPKSVSFQSMPYENHKEIYFVFVIIMVLLYSLCIWIDNKRNALFYLAVLSLLGLPLFKMGMWNDLVMRCSIPSLFILMYLILKFLNKYMCLNIFKDTNTSVIIKVLPILACVILLIGSYYPLLELKSSMETKVCCAKVEETNFGSMEQFANRNLHNIPDDVKYNYYSYNIENNLFYKIVSRNKI